MRKLNSGLKMALWGLVALVVMFGFSVTASATIDKTAIKAEMAKLSVPFIENQGQTDKQVKFYAHTFAGTVFVTTDGKIVYALLKNEEKGKTAGIVIAERFLGAKPR